MMNKKYNELYEILIFLFSALGILLTFHLHFTQLDPICLIGKEDDCTDLIGGFKLLGISNIYWGMLYYFLLTITSIIAIFLPIKLLIQVRNYSIIFGILYSIFLVSYQFAVNKFCFLCLISALFCLILFVLLISSKFYKNHVLPSYKSLNSKIIILLIVIGLIILDSRISRILADQSEPPSPCELNKDTLGWLDGNIGYNFSKDITKLSFKINHSDILDIEIHDTQKDNLNLKIEPGDNNQYSIKMIRDTLFQGCGKLLNINLKSDSYNPPNISDLQIHGIVSDTLIIDTCKNSNFVDKKSCEGAGYIWEQKIETKESTKELKDFKYYTGHHNIEIGNSIILGNPEAPITIIKWMDFQCPFCAKKVNLIDEILEKYPNDVKVVIKNFPMFMVAGHENAIRAAQYSLAANKQGKYKEMYHYLMENQDKLAENRDIALEYAKEIGLNIEQLIIDADSPEIEQQIQIEFDQLGKSNISKKGVPKFLINGRELWTFKAGRNIEDFSRVIDELKKLNDN